MELSRHKRLEEKLHNLMETTVDKLTEKLKGECAAADVQASIAMLKLNEVTLESAGRKGEDPDMPDEEDLPFTEGESVGAPLRAVK
ncbi:hypothetical protein [Geobacter sp. SVR]|uniref:hypothetical protein n=1 Tax=Geobacter sp. SVR TaxID=2495594 RepID=UPI00143F008C|nr:hypothetical protein [Geobacter sp. SVR]BCS53296.1 hypothetical protein GSVR_16040 [Geobacter sp. SVR]GCF85578.1 hypothetical protein GSbR_21780 [Geobacter sp. SVR]